MHDGNNSERNGALVFTGFSKHWLFALRLVVLMLCMLPTHAFIIGNKGGGPCLVACGGNGGAINVRFGGDVIAEYFTGPSIDQFEGATNRSVDRGIGKLDAVLAKQLNALDTMVTSQRTAFIDDLDRLSDSTIATLGDTLDERIATLVTELDKVLGQASVESRLFTLRIAREITIALLVVAVVVFLAGLFYFHHTLIGRTHKVSRKRLLTVAVGIIGICAFGALIATRLYTVRVIEIEDDLETHYKKALSGYQFGWAGYYASQLVQLQRDSFLQRARLKKANLLRDVFGQPARYRSKNGVRNISARIEEARSDYNKAGINRDFDLEVLDNVVSWQIGKDRFTEYVVACSMADLLAQSPPKDQDSDSHPRVLEPLAAHYLATYLGNPIPDEYLRIAGFDIAKENKMRPKGQGLYKTVAELRGIESSKSGSVAIGQDSKLYPYIAFGRSTVELVRSLNSTLAEGLILLARAREPYLLRRPRNLFDAHLSADQKKRLAGLLEHAEHQWSDYIEKLKDSQFDNTGVRLAATRVPHYYLSYMRLWKPLIEGDTNPQHQFLDPIQINICVRKDHKHAQSRDEQQKVIENCTAAEWVRISRSTSSAYKDLLTPELKDEIGEIAFTFLEKSMVSDWSEQYRMLSQLELASVAAIFQQRALASRPPVSASGPTGRIFLAMPDPINGIVWLSADLGLFACGRIDDDAMLSCADKKAKVTPYASLVLDIVPTNLSARKLVRDEVNLSIARRTLAAVN